MTGFFCFPAQMTTLTQEDNTSEGILADLAGRVLSRKSRQAIEDALAALKNLISHADKTGEEMPDEEDEPVMDMTTELSSGGYVVELGLTQGKPFAGFALGKFVDMHGRAVEFAKDNISEFLSNTIKAIDAAKAKRMPGLPIDAQKHDKGEAAGWIVSAELGEVTDSGGDTIPAIYLAAEWTSLGVRLLSDKILTNFSPTVDLTNKTIRGGSLTNWPASVDAKGVPLFNAVELTQAQTSDNPVVAAESQTDISDNEDKDMTIEMTQELEELVSARVKAALAEQNAGSQKVDLAQLVEAFGLNTEDAQQSQIKHLDELAQMVERQANLKWQQKLSTMQRENRTAELAQRVTGGTPDAPRGIPTQAEILKAELMKLSSEQAKFWGGLMETITQNGLVDFSELGHSKKLTGTHQLPAEYATALTEGKLTVADLSNPIIANDLGDLNQYDLSQWGKK